MSAVVKFLQDRFCIWADVKKLERTEIGSTQNGVVPVENED